MSIEIRTFKTIDAPAQRQQLERIVRGLSHGTPLAEIISKFGIESAKTLAEINPMGVAPYTPYYVDALWGLVNRLSVSGREDVSFTLVFETGGEIPVGFSMWKVSPKRILSPAFIGVDPDVRQRLHGIGSSLVTHLIGEAGQRRIILEIQSALNAVGFYRRFPCLTPVSLVYEKPEYMVPGATEVFIESIHTAIGPSLAKRFIPEQGREVFAVKFMALPGSFSPE